MLLSMTGFGNATVRQDEITVSVEIKAVNNRYLKISLRTNDSCAALEPVIENLLREQLRRGTITANIRVVCENNAADCLINEEVLIGYVQRVREINARLGIKTEPDPVMFLTLPGVTRELGEPNEKAQMVRPVLEKALKQALVELQAMRKREGDSMVADLRENTRQLLDLMAKVDHLAPQVVVYYRTKLTERIGRIMAEQNIELEPNDLIREVALFADRSDISEEIVRFRSHVRQFENIIEETDPKDGCGRRLDFLTQEMFREVNTIGSKANDSEITKTVVELKAVIERIREMVQNVE